MKIKLTGTSLNVDGQLIEDGCVCEVDDKSAQALIDRELAVEHDGSEDPAQDGGERADLIRQAVLDMMESDPEREDETAWTKSGKPDVKALSDMVGFEVSAAERDAAFDAANADQ